MAAQHQISFANASSLTSYGVQPGSVEYGLLNSVSVVLGPVVRILFPPPASRPDRCHKSKLKLAKAGRNILSLNHRLDFTWKHYATEDGFRAFGWPTRCRGEGSSRSCSKVGLDSTRTASASSFSAVFNRASQTHGVPARSAIGIAPLGDRARGGETTRRILVELERAQPRGIVFDSLSELRLLAQDALRYRRQINVTPVPVSNDTPPWILRGC